MLIIEEYQFLFHRLLRQPCWGLRWLRRKDQSAGDRDPSGAAETQYVMESGNFSLSLFRYPPSDHYYGHIPDVALITPLSAQ